MPKVTSKTGVGGLILDVNPSDLRHVVDPLSTAPEDAIREKKDKDKVIQWGFDHNSSGLVLE